MNWLKLLLPLPNHHFETVHQVEEPTEKQYDLTPYILLSQDIDPMDFTVLSPILFLIFADINLWCEREDLPLVVTNVVNERIDGVSVSDTHIEGRAIDFSVRDWTDADISKLESHFNAKYKSYGTSQSGLPKDNRVVVYHYGTGWHIHLQVKRD